MNLIKRMADGERKLALRKIIKIDESLCNGCGNCRIACSEGAIRLANGKARVVSDAFCDGRCLHRRMPRGSIDHRGREAEDFDEETVKAHLSQSKIRQEESVEMLSAARKESMPISPCKCSSP